MATHLRNCNKRFGRDASLESQGSRNGGYQMNGSNSMNGMGGGDAAGPGSSYGG